SSSKRDTAWVLRRGCVRCARELPPGPTGVLNRYRLAPPDPPCQTANRAPANAAPLARKLRCRRSRSGLPSPTLELLSPPMSPRPLALLTIPLVMVGLSLGASAADGDTAADGTESLTLHQAEQTALKNQPTVREAHGLYEAAEGRVEEARAGYLPQVTATGSYERTTANFAPRPSFSPTNTSTLGPLPPVSWNPKFNYYQLSVGASQLIYDFGQTSNKWSSAAASRDAAVDNTHTAALQTLLTVRRAYFTARADRDLVAVAEETVRNQEKHVEQTQAFVRTGIQPDINLATVRTALANATVQLVTARNNVSVADAQLAQAMGVSVGERYTLADQELPPIAGEDGAPGPLVEHAEKNRPELANIFNQ